MNICYLNLPFEYYSPVSSGAVGTIIMEQAKQLIARGHRVSILTIVGKDEVYNVGNVIPIRSGTREELNIIQRGISKILRKIYRWDWPYYEYYLFSFMKVLMDIRPRPDAIIVSNDFRAPIYVKKAVPGAKVMVVLHNEAYPDKKHIDKTISCVDTFLCVCGYLRRWMANAYGIPSNKLVTLLNGVNLETFKPRQDYLNTRDTLRVLYLGRIDPDKGVDIAVEAVEALQKEGLPIQMTVAGRLKYWGHSKEMIDIFLRRLKSAMVATKACDLGYVTRPLVPAMIREYDVVCVLSRGQGNESCSLVVLEAMASGCAVLASDRGGTPEASGGAAILVNPDDFDSVVSALRRLAADHNFLKAQKIKSIERAAKVSWSSNVDQLERLLMKENMSS